MVSGKATVRNNAGIHVRPSGIIFASVRDYRGVVRIKSGGRGTDLSSVMGLIAMGLEKGSEVLIEVDGPDERRKLEELKALFERRYDFGPAR